jgi:endonuclease YncB( thermonuclease family)
MRIFIAVVAVIIALSFGPNAQSCECGDTRAAACFRDASVIFEGEVLSMQIRTHALFEGMTLTKRTTTEYTVFTLRVGRVYKGTTTEIVRVATGIGTTDGSAAPDCSVPFEIGKNYLVYGLAGISEYGGLLYTNICAGTDLIGSANRYLRYVQGEIPTKEDELWEKEDLEKIYRLYASRATARISGRVLGKVSDSKAYLIDGLWRYQDGYWQKSFFSPKWTANKFAYSDLEPGEYRIGFIQVLSDGSRRMGFYGGGGRVDQAKSILIGTNDRILGVDVNLALQSKTVIQGKMECAAGISLKGQIRLQIADTWVHRHRADILIDPCVPFRIHDIHPGTYRIIGTVNPNEPDPLIAWTTNLPEINVPEQSEVVLSVERERLSERATSLSQPIWDIWTGRVRQVLNGDRIAVEIDGVGSQARMLRIAGIACPRKGHPRREEARLFTEKLLLGKTVTFFILQNESNKVPLEYEDSPGIRVGLPTNFAHNTAAELIKAGLAWHYTKYSADPELAGLEAEARKARRGIWEETNPPLKSQSKH